MTNGAERAMQARSWLKGSRFAILALLMASAAACASPEQKTDRYTKSGVEFLEKGDVAKANIQFLNALKINEDHTPALIGLAEVFERKQEFQSLFGVLQKVTRLDPNNVDAWIKLGKLYMIGNDTTEALTIADRAIGLAPENLDAAALKAAVLFKLDNKAEALAIAHKVLEGDPKHQEAVAIVATERVAAGDLEGGLAEIDRALKLDNAKPVLHVLRLQFLQSMGRTDDLMAGFRTLIEIEPQSIAYRQLFVRSLVEAKRMEEARDQLVEIAKLSDFKTESVLDVIRVENAIGGKDAALAAFARYMKDLPKNIDLKFAHAAFLRENKDYAGAEAAFSALADNKDEAIVIRARNEIAAQRLIEGKKEEARAIIDDILRQEPGNRDAMIKLSGLKIEAEDYDGAIADLRTVLNADPESSQARLLMATAFEQKGDLTFAKSEFAKAALDSDDDPLVASVFANFLIRNNEPARAEEILRASIGKHPNHVENLKLLASVQLMQQNWSEAEKTAATLKTVSENDPNVSRILGAAYAGLGNYAGVVDVLGKQNAASPLDGRPLQSLVEAYVRDSRAKEAETLLRGMIEKNPNAYDARLLLARLEATDGRNNDADATLRAALAAAPERPEAVEMAYRLMLTTGREAEVEPFLQEVLARSPKNFGALYMKADRFLSTGRREEALALYTDILKDRPQDPLAINNYASLLTELRDDAESLKRAAEVAKPLADSANPFFLDTAGWAYFRAGDVAAARATLEKAVAAAPGFAEGHYHLGATLVAAGETELARVQLEKALAAKPNEEVAAKVRALLTP